jgi:hypothetical protein
MDRWVSRAVGLLPAVWLGVLLCVALIATPAGFSMLPRTQAGALAGRILGYEATVSLAVGLTIVLLERWLMRGRQGPGAAVRPTCGMLLALGAVFCTVFGFYAMQQPMADARAGQGRFTFAQLHAVSLGVYGIKVLLVAMLAWRGAGGRPLHPTS